jgi:hypothetical protein
MLWAVLYFFIIVSIDYIAADEIFTTRYFIKKLVSAIIGAFVFSLLLSPENPFRKKKSSA